MATGESIMARARTVATQTGGDANQSASIDAKGGIRVLLNNAIREVYRRKAGDMKFRNDIVVENTITITGGVGTVPDEIMREFMHQANIETEDNALVSFFDYPIDANSGQTYAQLGYLWIVGDEFRYLAPAPDLANFDGDITVQVPSFPVFPPSMSSDIVFPSDATVDDVVLMLATAITGKEIFQIVSA